MKAANVAPAMPAMPPACGRAAAVRVCGAAPCTELLAVAQVAVREAARSSRAPGRRVGWRAAQPRHLFSQQQSNCVEREVPNWVNHHLTERRSVGCARNPQPSHQQQGLRQRHWNVDCRDWLRWAGRRAIGVMSGAALGTTAAAAAVIGGMSASPHLQQSITELWLGPNSPNRVSVRSMAMLQTGRISCFKCRPACGAATAALCRQLLCLVLLPPDRSHFVHNSPSGNMCCPCEICM